MGFLLFLATLCTLAILYARFIEPNRLVVRRVHIRSNRRLGGEAPLRIALLSDFHYPRLTRRRQVRRAIERSNALQPDLVFLLGDFYARGRSDPALLPDDFGTAFGSIHSHMGVFGVLGNHDHSIEIEAIENVLRYETNIHLIDNKAVRIDRPDASFYIIGVGDLWAGDAHYGEAVRDVPPTATILLLSHNPDVVEEINDPRILMQFSGHTHGGQIRLPFIGALKVPSRYGNRYASGLIHSGRHLLYVNSGICSMKNVRFLCPPEVTLIEIE